MSSSSRSQLTVAFYIILWFLANGSTILLNKYLFKILEFTNPLALTLVHMTTQAILAYLTLDVFNLIDKIYIERNDFLYKILPIAVVFCFNIVLGNVSLRFVPVSFMQTVKSLTPACTALLQYLVFRSRLSRQALLALVPVTFGVTLATMTEMSFHFGGFLAALTACFLTGLKFVLSSAMLSGKYKLDSVNLLYYMCPAAIVILVPMVYLLEYDNVVQWVMRPETEPKHLWYLLFSGVLSFALNFTLFIVLKATSSVTVTVAGNLKTVGVIAISIVMFKNPVTWLNALGCLVAIMGCTMYGLTKNKWITMGTMDTGDKDKEKEKMVEKVEQGFSSPSRTHTVEVGKT